METPSDMKRTVKATVDPGWAETSVRWLRANYISYVPAVSKLPADVVLLKALKKMLWRRVQMASFGTDRWIEYISNESLRWSWKNHTDMVKFLQEGGHGAAEARAKEKLSKRAEARALKAKADPETETDTTALDFDELENSLAKDNEPRSQLSPSHELEEIIADAALASDPRFGVW